MIGLRGGVAALLVATQLCGCSVFYWDVPVRGAKPPSESADDPDQPKKQAEVAPNISPDRMCALIGKGALHRKTLDTVLGAVLGVLGGSATSAGTALAVRSGHSATWQGLWSGTAGMGAVVTAIAIYFIVKSGSDRQEYWIANSAVAKIHADFVQYPSMLAFDPETYKAFQLWQADLKNESKRAAFETALTNYRRFLSTFAGHEYLVDVAAEYKKQAAKLSAQVTQLTADAALAQTDLSTALTLFQAAQSKYQDAVDAHKPATETQPLLAALAPLQQKLTDAQAAAKSTRDAVDAMAKDAAEASANAADLNNAVLGLQTAWADCSTALLSIGSSDAAASTAFAGALSSSGSGGKSSGSGSGTASGSTTGGH